ncbi:hypothetical protein NDU88_001538 [Pleurodeles waltl]|uniref:Uncharacterized protein n=1 Tax=Pleurodeles waltl TaxID=8319 RepID=A0AAV7R9D2_PLEWA|nr:hypothetical protein NDU88_001538 [Pleurodeles waltl]
MIDGIKKEQLTKVAGLEADIRVLKMVAGQSGRPCPERCHQLRLRQQELRDLADGRARVHALATQRRLYDVGDKANKLMPWLKSRDRGRNWVVTVRDAARQACRTGGDIAEASAEYYEWLYESRVEFIGVECADLLENVSLQTLTPEDRDALEEEPSDEEVEQALRELQSGKTARPNGYRHEGSEEVAVLPADYRNTG